jgi:hypothetical protein
MEAEVENLRVVRRYDLGAQLGRLAGLLCVDPGSEFLDDLNNAVTPANIRCCSDKYITQSVVQNPVQNRSTFVRIAVKYRKSWQADACRCWIVSLDAAIC